jgi:hypothetical protein
MFRSIYGHIHKWRCPVAYNNRHTKTLCCGYVFFILATRVYYWKLHLKSLNDFWEYQFAHDRINYAWIVRLHVHKRKTCDVYAVNKNEVRCSSIGLASSHNGQMVIQIILNQIKIRSNHFNEWIWAYLTYCGNWTSKAKSSLLRCLMLRYVDTKLMLTSCELCSVSCTRR